jgi:hypothetical protein
MASKRTSKANTAQTPRAPEHQDPQAVEAHIALLEPAIKEMVQALRRTILKADPRISEGIKWRSVSFYCEGWFATLQERSKHGLLLVLHLGAKKRAAATLRSTIEDADQVLHWHSPDRASIAFATPAACKAQQASLLKILKQWLAYQLQDGSTRLLLCRRPAIAFGHARERLGQFCAVDFRRVASIAA